MYEEVDIVEEQENPFKSSVLERVVLIGNIEKLNKLSDNGRLVLKFIPETLDIHTGTAKLDVKAICMFQYGVYDETSATRIRRGIRNLKANKVIANTTKRNYYWINRGVIWK